MADFMYNVAKASFFRGDIDLENDDIRVMVLETDAEDADHANLAAIITAGAVEATSTNYSRATLTGETVSQSDANDRAEFDANDPTFSSISQAGSESWTACVVYKHVDGTNANDIPIVHVDSGFPVTPNGSDITIAWNANGIAHLT